MSKNVIHGHKVDVFNRENIAVERVSGLGDPCVEGKVYVMTVLNAPTPVPQTTSLFFQEGPVATSGPNGITNEALLAVVIDRLECFQRGAYKCRENALAITKLEEALHWLGHRSNDRERRGVEGKNDL
jgi:hypothetical protein